MAKGSKQKGKKPTEKQLETIRIRLAPFLKNNPTSKIERVDFPGEGVAVTSPWGDTSLELFLPSKPEPLIQALNSVILPERFTAIWHLDTKSLEVIYTVYGIEEKDRSFAFTFNDVTYECTYGDSSDRLLLLAEHYFPIAARSVTDYRNLDDYSDYVLAEKGIKGVPRIPSAKPVSFWIKGLDEWNPDVVLVLATHLNFYMTYYDTSSAQILIHSPVSETFAMQPETRFCEGSFPPEIRGRLIEETLLHFWRASREDSDPIRSFLNNYLILEYAAFFYIDDSVKRNVRKCLIDPTAIVDIDGLTQRLVEAIGEKMQEDQRIQHMLKNCVRPKLVWQEIEKNRNFFSSQQKFDGGFVLEPMITPQTSEKEFSANWELTFERKIRSIRNALSHGKEQRTLSTISPTTRNFQLLERWVPPIAVAAREVMVYREIA